MEGEKGRRGKEEIYKFGGNASERFLFGDMNHDGNLDFATTRENGTPFFGDGTGNFVNCHLNLPVQAVLGFTDIS